jgi:hypothetical protein
MQFTSQAAFKWSQICVCIKFFYPIVWIFTVIISGTQLPGDCHNVLLFQYTCFHNHQLNMILLYDVGAVYNIYVFKLKSEQDLICVWCLQFDLLMGLNMVIVFIWFTSHISIVPVFQFPCYTVMNTQHSVITTHTL